MKSNSIEKDDDKREKYISSLRDQKKSIKRNAFKTSMTQDKIDELDEM